MNELSEEIKNRRKILQLRQADIAELTGLSEKTIRNMEMDVTKVSVANLMKVLEILGVQIKLELIKDHAEKGQNIQ